jgi:purine-binding chemotaxis protein CheW
VKSDNRDKPSNAQLAMLDFYDDMLGSLLNDPLKALEKEELVKEELAAKVTSSAKNKKTINAPTQESFEQKLVPKPFVPRQKRQVKKSPTTYYESVYEERFKTEVVAPLIITAAFPKMAPQEEAVPKKAVSEPIKATTSKVPLNNAPLSQAAIATPIIEPAKSNKVEIVDKPLSGSVQTTSLAPTIQTAEKDALVNSLATTNPISTTADSDSKDPLIEALVSNGRPVWAQERFECLLFSVAGLQLAVPLASLGAIYKIESHFTPLVGRASWFMGLYRHDERNIRVVDTAQLVMPDRVDDKTRENYKFIIRLGGNNWGIACDSVQESIQLEPEAVKWRTERSKRAWLSGTVIKHMCALIDVDALTSILKKEALSKHSSFNV